MAAVGFVLGFLPWIVYWVLVGNAPFQVAVLVALAVATAGLAVTRLRGEPWRTLDVGNLAVFVLLAVAAFVIPDPVLERWLQPLGNAGLFVIALVGVLIDRPFVREYAESAVDPETARTDGFRTITTGMTWLWVAIFGGMTVLALIPPIVDGEATIRDSGSTLSVLCYWVFPYVLMGVGGVLNGAFPPWFEARSALVDSRGGELPVAPPAPAEPDTADGLVLDLPADSRHDEPFGIVVRGAADAVELSVTGSDLFGREWRSSATFVAGPVDVATDAPIRGDWTTADPDAPLWAMRFAADSTPDMFVPPEDPWLVTVRARSGPASARRTVRRRAAGAGVRLVPTSVDGREGLLALPAGGVPPGGWPAVVCFGGSEGGFASQVGNAALLASRGFAALAAGWISESDAAKAVAHVPLERFAAALERLAGHEGVDASRLAAMGISRGAEGLLAAVCTGLGPRLSGTVLVSPSCVTWQAVGSGGEVPDTASWTLAAAPVPWRPLPTGVLMRQLVRNGWRVHRDIAEHRPSLLSLRPAYEAGLAGADDAAVIASERAPGPLLCLTGDADELWPSGPMAEALLARRARTDDHHVHFPGAGHLIRLGLFPTDAPWSAGIAFGGDRAGLAEAQRIATARVLVFLHTCTALFSTPSP